MSAVRGTESRMRAWRPRLLAALLSIPVVLAAASARAQVVNGDFEQGGTGWSLSIPTGWSGGVLSSGGNPTGCGYLQSSASNLGGEARLMQFVSCGDPEPGMVCDITFDYKVDAVAAADTLTGRVTCLIDGLRKFVAPQAAHSPWTTTTVTVPCGSHQVWLCIEVDPAEFVWRGTFDNVKAECRSMVPVEPRTWGRIKAMYRPPVRP